MIQVYELLDININTRNYMNHYGRKYMHVLDLKASAFEVSGWRMLPTKGKVQ